MPLWLRSDTACKYEELSALVVVVFQALSCVRLFGDSIDCRLSGSLSVGFFQARILERVAISFSMGIFPTQGSNPGLLHCRQMLY